MLPQPSALIGGEGQASGGGTRGQSSSHLLPFMPPHEPVPSPPSSEACWLPLGSQYFIFINLFLLLISWILWTIPDFTGSVKPAKLEIKYACVCVFVYTRTHTYACIHTYIHMYVCMHAYVCVCVYNTYIFIICIEINNLLILNVLLSQVYNYFCTNYYGVFAYDKWVKPV